MACFRVEMKYVRTKTFFVEAENEDEVYNFVDSDPEWNPSDVEGLLDSDESEDDEYAVYVADGIVPIFKLVDGELEIVG